MVDLFLKVLPIVLGLCCVASHATMLHADDMPENCIPGGLPGLYVTAMIMEPKGVHHKMIRQLLTQARDRRTRIIADAFLDQLSENTDISWAHMTDATTGKDCVKTWMGPGAPSVGPNEDDDNIVHSIEDQDGISSTLKSIAIATSMPIWDSKAPDTKLSHHLRIIFAVTEGAPPQSWNKESFPSAGLATCAANNPTIRELSRELERTNIKLVMIVRGKHQELWENAFRKEETRSTFLIPISTVSTSSDEMTDIQQTYLNNITAQMILAAKTFICLKDPEKSTSKPESALKIQVLTSSSLRIIINKGIALSWGMTFLLGIVTAYSRV